MATTRRVGAVRFLAGTLLAGYGALVVLRVLAHEAVLVGLGMVIAGGLILWSAHLRVPVHTPLAAERVTTRGHAAVTAALGIAAAGGVVTYNTLARSTLEVPELAILGYGIALVAAAPHLDARVGRLRVERVVAWSLPLVAAPLGLYALDAALDASVGGSPLDAFITHLLVAPMAWSLQAMGLDTTTTGQTIMLATPRGKLALGIGLVCAGLHPGVLFLGVFGLYAWEERTPPTRLALLLALGLFGVYLANLVRLVALALVGYQWGGATLQTAHAHAGWILFLGWMLAYWGVVLRRFHGRDPKKPVDVPPAT